MTRVDPVVADGDTARPGIVVAVDCHSRLLPTVEFAIRLADAKGLAVHGLCLEDPDLAMVSSLPFSQEISLLSARPRALEEQHLQRTLEGFSRRFRQLLSERAERASLQYSFGRAQGRRQALDLGSGSQPAYVVMGQPGPVRERGRVELRALIVCAETEAALPVLQCLMAGDANRPLELLLVNGSGGDEGNEGNECLQQFVAAHPGVMLLPVALMQLADILRRPSQQPDLVITSRQCDGAVLDKILELSACPVILLQDHSSNA